nr:uncharacterized protein LOC100186329 [Ciona intestinalis]|eukprot:XP_026691519.1 uncharacterized protein LOC100186329 [Ciona intestinalis]
MTNRHHNANPRSAAPRGDAVTWVGGNCGRHGSYVFYKAFRYHITSEPTRLPSLPNTPRGRTRDRRHQSEASRSDDADSPDDVARDVIGTEERILALGEFFFVQCRPEDPVCVGELQLLWHDKHSGQDLASTRLYYLPDTTPAGRTSQHGEDEMLAVSEKIVMRTTDLASWLVEPEEWNYGSPLLLTPKPPNGGVIQPTTPPLHRYSLLHSSVNMQDVLMERKALNTSTNTACCLHSNATAQEDGSPVQQTCQCNGARRHKAEVLMLSVSAYCRHKALMKRIEGTERDWLERPGAGLMLAALGIFTSDNPRARVVFCRDTFDYPQLFEHDLICEELAPVFKGRPRKKPKNKNGSNGSKLGNKKSSGSAGIRNVANKQENASSEKDGEALTPTRRYSSRRRSKRKSPQTSLYEQEFAPQSRSNKRSRRTSARTPTPVSELSDVKPRLEASSRSEPASPDSKTSVNGGYASEATVAQTIDAAAQAAVTNSWKKKTRPKRRPGRRSSTSALSIAIKNSLLENNPVSKENDSTENKTSQVPRPPSTSSCVSSSSDPSSRSSSPSIELRTRDLNTQAPTQRSDSPASVASSIASHDGLSSPSSGSPLDFTAIMSDDQCSVRANVTPLTTEDSESLRGLRDGKILESQSAFLELLYQFMRKRNTPIGRIPSLGFKKLDLWTFFKLSQEYGGYDMVTAKRLWKHVYDRMGGNPSCTSAATCTRKHFEKLLLPLEMHLRKTLRPKDNDLTKNKLDGEVEDVNSNSTTPLHISPQLRTFNGDAYFHNETSLHKPGKPATHSTATDQQSKRTEILVGKQQHYEKGATPLSSTNSTSCIAASVAPFVNFEALAHSVIRDELLANRGPHSSSQRHQNEHSLSPRPHDLTKTPDSHPASTRAETTRIITPSPSERQGVVTTVPSTQHSHFGPPLFSIRTRTHCPRSSGAPPPFVPTRSKPVQLLAEAGARLGGDNGEGSRSKPPMFDDKHDSERLAERHRNQQKRQFGEVSNPASSSPSSPKRPCPATSLTTPSPSNRRYDIRNLVSIPTEDNSKTRNPDIGSAKTFPNPDGPRQQVSETEATRLKYDPLIRRVFPDHRPTKVAPIGEHDAERTQSRQVTPKSHVTDRGVRNPDETNRPREEFVDRHWRPEVGIDRKRESEDAHRRSSATSSSGYYYPPKNNNTSHKEAYYRPVGMIASYREAKQRIQQQQQQKHTPSDPAPKPGHHTQQASSHEKMSGPHMVAEERKILRPSSPHRPSGNGTSHYQTPTPKPLMQKRDSQSYSHHHTPSHNARPPTKREPDSERKPFSASFSVDRLTAKSHDAPNPHKPQPPKQEPTQQRYPFVPGRVATPKQSPYADRCAPDRRSFPPSATGDPFRSQHSLSHPQGRNGATPTRLSKPEYIPDRSPRDGKSDIFATPPGRAKDPSPPVKHGSHLSPSARALLANLPPPVASAIYPYIPKDCPPHVLARILQETEKVIGITPGAPPVPPPLDIMARHQAHFTQQQKQLEHQTALQDAVLRQHLAGDPFRMISPQEQQAAAMDYLARAASAVNGGTAPNMQPGPDPALMASKLQMYQLYTQQLASLHQNVARQLQETAGPSVPQAAKLGHVTSSDMLQQLARISSGQIGNGTTAFPDLRNPSYLAATPQIPPQMTPEVAARLAYSIGRR